MPPEQKSPAKAIALVLLVLDLLLVALLFLGGGGAQGRSQASGVQADTDGNSSSGRFPTSANNFDPARQYQIGESATWNGLSVTFSDVSSGTGQQLFTPADGNEFVVCRFDLRNETPSELPMYSIFLFHASIDGNPVNPAFSSMMSGDGQVPGGMVAPGQQMSGIFGFEAPVGWTRLQVEFSPEVLEGGAMVFEAVNPGT